MRNTKNLKIFFSLMLIFTVMASMFTTVMAVPEEIGEGNGEVVADADVAVNETAEETEEAAETSEEEEETEMTAEEAFAFVEAYDHSNETDETKEQLEKAVETLEGVMDDKTKSAYDKALDFINAYDENVENTDEFKAELDTAIATVKEEIPSYASWLSLLPPIIAIALALITKEVYSSLFIGILSGALLYANFNFAGTLEHVTTGFIDNMDIGIIIFLVLLGTIVALMNKSGGSAAFGRWASTHIKSKVGAQLATIALGVLIFVDDYFNCLTVGSVMRPVSDKAKLSRAKLAYIIDSTAAPVCIIAPVSSWAAAVTGYIEGEDGFALFVKAIPWNFYALLTIVMMITIAFMKFDFGPMKKHEAAAENGDLFSSDDAEMFKTIEEKDENKKGMVLDLILPVVVLIIGCVLGLIHSGGFFTAESEYYMDFIGAFGDASASTGLVYGGFGGVIFSIIYFLLRRVLNFKQCMEALPEGFKAMVPAIMILACAWTLNAMTKSLGAQVYIAELVRLNAGSAIILLPAIVFIVAVGLSFSTGTSWGTFGILIPIVLAIFGGIGEEYQYLQIVAISACMAGAVCGDHCSPISDTTIMASAGAQSNHINHVTTQLPYALTVAAVSFVCYIIAGLVKSAWIALPIGIFLMIGTLFVIKVVTKKKS